MEKDENKYLISVFKTYHLPTVGEDITVEFKSSLLTYNGMDLKILCEKNPEAKEQCKNENFWMDWIKSRYGNKIFQLKDPGITWKEYGDHIIDFHIENLDQSIRNGIVSDLELATLLYPNIEFSSRQVDIAIENQQYEILRWFLDHNVLPDNRGIDLLFDNSNLDLLIDIYNLRNKSFESPNLLIDISSTRNKSFEPSNSINTVIITAIKSKDFSTFDKLAKMNIVPSPEQMDTISYMNISEGDKIDYFKYMASLGNLPSNISANVALEANNFKLLKYLQSIGRLPEESELIKFLSLLNTKYDPTQYTDILNILGIDLMYSILNFDEVIELGLMEVIEWYLNNNKKPSIETVNKVTLNKNAMSLLNLFSKYKIYPDHNTYEYINNIKYSEDKFDILKWLIDHDIYSDDQDIINGIFQNVSEELNYDVLNLLMNHEIYPDNSVLDDIIRHAISNKNTNILEILYRYNINFTDSDIKYALSLYLNDFDPTIINWLSKLDKKTKDKVNELEDLIILNWLKLYSHTPNIDAARFAAEMGDIPILDWLFHRENIDINDDNIIRNAIIYSIMNNDNSIVNWLLDNGVSQEKINKIKKEEEQEASELRELKKSKEEEEENERKQKEREMYY